MLHCPVRQQHDAADHEIVLDNSAPYGNIMLTLDNVNTSGMLQLSSVGNASICIKGDVTTGAIIVGEDCRLSISGAQDSESNTLAVNSVSVPGISAGREVYIHDLESLQICSGENGVFTETGNIILKNVTGFIKAGKDCAALKSEHTAAVILVNGSKVADIIGVEHVF